VLDKLINEHRASLVRFLSSRLKNHEEAEDIAQAALLRIHRLQNTSEIENPKAYLFQVANNLAVDNIRRHQLHRNYQRHETAARDSDVDCSVDSHLSPERVLAAQQQLQLIYAAIDRLPVKARQAFILHRKNGLSYSEIAEQMEVSVSSVEKYILVALKQCRHAIEVSTTENTEGVTES